MDGDGNQEFYLFEVAPGNMMNHTLQLGADEGSQLRRFEQR